MAIYETGTLTVGTGGVAQNLNLGFIPSSFKMSNQTTITGVFKAEWNPSMANATAWIWTTAAAPVFSLQATVGVTPFQTTDASLWTSTNLTITGISKAANASITATHAFTSADIGVTTVTISGVKGMTQINTLRGVIQTVTSTTSFTVNINSTSFSTWTSGGIANIITGIPASTVYSNTQILNTAQANVGQIGLTLGTALMVNTSDVWFYEAILNTPVTS